MQLRGAGGRIASMLCKSAAHETLATAHIERVSTAVSGIAGRVSRLDRAKIHEVLTKLQFTASEDMLDSIMSLGDESGHVDYRELLVSLARRDKGGRALLHLAIKIYDADHDDS